MTLKTPFVKQAGTVVVCIWVLGGIPMSAIAAPAREDAPEPPTGPGLALEGKVVQVEGDLAVIDLGEADGLVPGDRVTLFQALPAGPKEVGKARVVRVGETRAWVGLRRLPRGAIRPGDLVRADPADWAPREEAEDREAGRPEVAGDRESDREPPPRRVAVAPRVAHDPVSRWTEGRDLILTFSVQSDQPLSGMMLRWKTGRRGEWREVPLEPAGDTAWQARIPGESLAPGEVLYHVVARGPAGDERPLFAGQQRPWKVQVDPRPRAATRGQVGISGSFEWQEAYLTHGGRDTWWTAETALGYRVGRGVLDEIRVGFGAFEGVGGSRFEVEEGFALDYRSLGYGFLEARFRFGRYVRWIPRLVLGAFWDFCDDCEYGDYQSYARGDVMGGAGSRFEFGPEDRFFVSVEGNGLATVGGQFLVGAMGHAGHGVWVGGRIGGTSWPVAQEWATRIEWITAWRGLPWLGLEARLGANIRSTDHAGIGGGLNLAFWW
ncbi:MAG TPA: hypothetical protein PLQ97_00200 [Myxococcota bacterium]|nr:hypothetical protein [Myxococcota bacterium]HQK49594.1 hypothetical protein [Myxococcota bacterium]